MCLMNGKNNDGGIHPLDISVPLSCASASHSHSAVLFFFLFARGAACPRARDAQDTTKQTGAFSLPLFLYISGREAWQSLCQVLRTLRPIADAILVRVLNILFLFCLRSSSRRKVAPLSTNYCAYIRRRRLQRLLSSPTRQKSSSDLQLSLNLSGVIRLRYKLMCLGRIMTGKFTP